MNADDVSRRVRAVLRPGSPPESGSRPEPGSPPRVAPSAAADDASAAAIAAKVAIDAAGRRAAQAPRANDPVVALLELEAQARRQASTLELGLHLVNETRRVLPFGQAFLLERAHDTAPYHVRAASSLATVDRNVPAMRWIESIAAALGAAAKAAGSKADQATTFELPAHADADAEETRTWPHRHALWQPLHDPLSAGRGDDATARGVLFFAAKPWLEAHEQVGARLAETYAHAFRALEPRHARSRALRVFGRRRARLAAVAAVLVVCAWPVPLSALAPVEITAADPAIVAAPMNGVVQSILVAPDTRVTKGQPILRFEDTRLRSELELAERRLQVAAARLGGTAQAAIDSHDAGREVAIDRAEYDLAKAQHAYAKALHDQAVVLAPRDGVVVYSDRRDWQGRPVETGQQILQLADPSRVEFTIRMPVADAMVIAPGARVKVYLDSRPLAPLDARVERANYHAEKTETDGLAFTLIAQADDGAPLDDRVGTRGTAKVYGAKVPLIYHVLRRPIAALRQQVGL